MTYEIDLPCTDCGSALEGRTVPLPEWTRTDTISDGIPVAVCLHCEARHYAESGLSKLFDSGESRTRRGS